MRPIAARSEIKFSAPNLARIQAAVPAACAALATGDAGGRRIVGSGERFIRFGALVGPHRYGGVVLVVPPTPERPHAATMHGRTAAMAGPELVANVFPKPLFDRGQEET